MQDELHARFAEQDRRLRQLYARGVLLDLVGEVVQRLDPLLSQPDGPVGLDDGPPDMVQVGTSCTTGTYRSSSVPDNVGRESEAWG